MYIEFIRGSGTTLVQANELGINALGIDISNFNTIISNSKISYIDLRKLEIILKELTEKLENYVKINSEFENELNEKLFVNLMKNYLILIINTLIK